MGRVQIQVILVVVDVDAILKVMFVVVATVALNLVLVVHLGQMDALVVLILIHMGMNFQKHVVWAAMMDVVVLNKFVVKVNVLIRGR